MMRDTSRVIVKHRDGSSLSADDFTVSHRDFPEVRAQGRSPEQAAARLVEKFVRALDNAPSHWRRDHLERAIEDVRTLAEGRSGVAVDRPGVVSREDGPGPSGSGREAP